MTTHAAHDDDLFFDDFMGLKELDVHLSGSGLLEHVLAAQEPSALAQPLIVTSEMPVNPQKQEPFGIADVELGFGGAGLDTLEQMVMNVHFDQGDTTDDAVPATETSDDEGGAVHADSAPDAFELNEVALHADIHGSLAGLDARFHQQDNLMELLGKSQSALMLSSAMSRHPHADPFLANAIGSGPAQLVHAVPTPSPFPPGLDQVSLMQTMMHLMPPSMTAAPAAVLSPLEDTVHVPAPPVAGLLKQAAEVYDVQFAASKRKTPEEERERNKYHARTSRARKKEEEERIRHENATLRTENETLKAQVAQFQTQLLQQGQTLWSVLVELQRMQNNGKQ